MMEEIIMELNDVHGTQKAYRKILQSMARPGENFILPNETNNIMAYVTCLEGTKTLLYTLLDSSVTFHIPTENQQMIDLISTYTLARHETIETADFIICPKGTSEQQLIRCMEKCAIGTLTDPHLSTTFIIEQSMNEQLPSLPITGPGVKEVNKMKLAVPEDVLAVREARLQEFPLGFDMIFVQEDGNIFSLPRTSHVGRKVTQ